MVCLPRRSVEMIDSASYSLSSRLSPEIGSYQWKVGSNLVPGKPVTLYNASNTFSYAEGFTEIMKSFHSLSFNQNNSSLTALMFNKSVAGVAGSVIAAADTGASSWKNAFAIAQDLTCFSNRQDIMICGLNTLSQQLYFEINHERATGNNPFTLDFYANYDHLLILDGQTGILSAKF
jgi:hypothetical protein